MQYESSIAHQKNLAAGLTVAEHREIGSADWGISLIRYSDGSTWIFDNAAGWRIADVYGWEEANRSLEPAWFLTRARAESFDTGCGSIFGPPSVKRADLANLCDILP